MVNKKELEKLINYIEQKLRASQTEVLDFVDNRNFKERLKNHQNHVIFGRRGAGKSSLLSSLKQEPELLRIKIDLENYKEISFPNIIIHVLIECLEQLCTQFNKKAPFNLIAFINKRKIIKVKKALALQLYEPDETEESQRRKNFSEKESSAGAKANQLTADRKTKHGSENEISRVYPVKKIDFLKKEFPNYKKIISEASEALDAKISISLDDFYFVPKSVQADFIDYFHRLTKGTNLRLKVATIKHRTKLYKQTSETYIGTELGHDIFDIDMDYTLDKFTDLKNFMRELLGNACRSSNANIDIDDLFSGEGFSQLCMASGGVPRDFLLLFVNLASKITRGEIQSIGKVNVNEAAIENHSSKLASFGTDSAEEKETLEQYLRIIKEQIYTQKRTNVFLVAKADLNEFPHERQAIRELVDLRLLHLIDTNTSCAPSDGRRYEAYMLDIGLYDNARPRNFSQIEPGATDKRSRKDELRASPKLELQQINKLNLSMLEVTDELPISS